MPDPVTAPYVFTLHDLLVSTLTIAGSFAGAWIAAKLAFANFYRQQIWQRKAEAYSTVFQAITGVERWYLKHFEALVRGSEIAQERKAKLQAEANQAEEDLESA